MPVQPSQRVDYDRIAHLYDEPLRDHTADPNLTQFLNEHPALNPSELTILDMGCGTGKQLATNRHTFAGMQMVGLDLFAGMLRQAQKRGPGVHWIQGNSARTPFQTACFDYITNQYSYPHVQDKPGMMAETYRILKPGGRFVMTNVDPWAMPDWTLYRYFPEARDRDFADFLPAETFAEGLKQAGFTNIQTVHRVWQSRGTLQQFHEYASQRFRVSQLIALPEDAYQAGMDRIRAAIAQSGSDAEVESVMSLITISADKL